MIDNITDYDAMNDGSSALMHDQIAQYHTVKQKISFTSYSDLTINNSLKLELFHKLDIILDYTSFDPQMSYLSIM